MSSSIPAGALSSSGKSRKRSTKGRWERSNDDEVDVAQAIRFAPRPRAEQVGGLHAVTTEQRGEPSREPAGYRSRRSRVLAHRRILPAARRAARAWAAEKASAGAMPGSASG